MSNVETEFKVFARTLEATCRKLLDDWERDHGAEEEEYFLGIVFSSKQVQNNNFQIAGRCSPVYALTMMEEFNDHVKEALFTKED